MNKRLLSTAVLIYILFSLPVEAQNTHETTPQKRPTVGLVLSGGGAKGFAYVGILKAIQKAGLRLDYIGGTSMGSIMGGMYAIGYHPDTIAKIIRSQDWDMVIKDKVARRYIAFEEKSFTENTIATLPLRKNKIELKESLYQGQQINLLLNKFFSPEYRTWNFSKLPTPFYCMGTDILNGKSVLLNKGYLPMAIRSSMSIPGYFSPTHFQGKYLVDGGVVNNYPANEMKNLGIDFVLGADVQNGLYKDIKKLNTVPRVLNQVIGYYRVAANQLGYAATDKYIHIDVPYDIMDFDANDSIIAIGERVASKVYPYIKKLSDSLNSIEYRPVREKNARPLDSVSISNVEFEGYEKVSLTFLKDYFDQFRNKKVALNDIERMVRMAYGTKYFKHVYYELRPDRDKTNLVIKVQETSPGTIGAALHYDSDYQGSILLNVVLRNQLIKGSKLFAQTTLGSNPRFKALYLIDKGFHIGFGTLVDIFTFNFNTYLDNQRLTSYKFTNHALSFFLNSNLKNLYNLRTGIELDRFIFKQTYVSDTTNFLSNKTNTYGNLFFSFNADTYDKAYFPTTGIKLSLNVKYVFDMTADKASSFEHAIIGYLDYDLYFKLSRRWVLSTGVFQGITLGNADPPAQYYFYLGGQNPQNYLPNFVPFSGLRFVQKTGRNTSIARLCLRYNYLKNLYVSAALDAGIINNSLNQYFVNQDLIFGYGIKFSYESFIGPVEIAFMNSSHHTGTTVYFNLGYWF